MITLAGLRRLRFGNRERDKAGRALIAALGLVALAEQDARGYALRSRCDLVCDGRTPLELVHADGSTDAVVVETADRLKVLAGDARRPLVAQRLRGGAPLEMALIGQPCLTN